MRKTKRHPEKGSSLLLAILALLLLSAIAAGMAFMSGTETAINSNFKAEETAYFAARAGIEEARDRMLSANANTISSQLPALAPTSSNDVLYVVQPGITATDIADSTNAKGAYDDELCHDYSFGGMTSASANVRCTTANTTQPQPSSYSPRTTNSVAPFNGTSSPLEFKWVRITVKANNSTNPYCVNGPTSCATNSSTVCWNGAETVLSGATYCTGLTPPANPVYLLTALAVTNTGARRIVQQELAQLATTTSSTSTSTLPNIGMFAAGTGCNATPPLQLAGGAHTGSFNSSSQSSWNSPPPTSNSNGNVGANGNIDLQGSSTQVNGSVSTSLSVPGGAPGACPADGVSTSGNPTYNSLTGGAPTYAFPTPSIPTVASGAQCYGGSGSCSGGSSMTAGSFGDVTIKGAVTLTGGTTGHPAVYNMNSLTFNGGGTLTVSGPVIINLAGNNVTNALDATGGSFTNSTYVPGNLVINYGGTDNMYIGGGSGAYMIIDAPNAGITMRGNANYYGQILGKTIDDSGGTSFYWDQGATAITDITTTTHTTESANFYNVSMRELTY